MTTEEFFSKKAIKGFWYLYESGWQHCGALWSDLADIWLVIPVPGHVEWVIYEEEGQFRIDNYLWNFKGLRPSYPTLEAAKMRCVIGSDSLTEREQKEIT